MKNWVCVLRAINNGEASRERDTETETERERESKMEM